MAFRRAPAPILTATAEAFATAARDGAEEADASSDALRCPAPKPLAGAAGTGGIVVAADPALSLSVARGVPGGAAWAAGVAAGMAAGMAAAAWKVVSLGSRPRGGPASTGRRA